MNPPFGTKVKGADVDFLRTAFAIASGNAGQRTGEDDDEESNASISTVSQRTDDQGDTQQQREKTVIYSLHKTRCDTN